MDSLTDDSMITRAQLNSSSDMPKSIASLPPRLRLKLLYRSEDNVTTFESGNDCMLNCIGDDPETVEKTYNPNGIDEETDLDTKCDYEDGSIQTSHGVGSSPEEYLGSKFASGTPSPEYDFKPMLSADAIQLGRDDNDITDNLLPIWYNRAIVSNKSNTILMQKLKDLPSYVKCLLDITKPHSNLQASLNYKDARKNIQELLDSLVASNMKFCRKENVEHYFWKILYYNLIEHLKKQCKTNIGYKEMVLDIIREGTTFYHSLLNTLRRTNNFETSSNLHPDSNKLEILAKVTAQKIYISLGDLARYEEQIVGRNEFVKATEYYHIARKLVPTNGIPYNQLAILSIYSKRKFDAIYYHMRSLTASNPIHSARESLAVLFDEIRKKFESRAESKTPQKSTTSEASVHKLASVRKEIWIHPDGSRRLYRISPYSSKNLSYLDEQSLKELSSEDLFKRFQLTYLCIIGKLFTKIGMENFGRILFQMLTEFKELLERDFLLYSKNRLLQIISLNIFVIECNDKNNEDRSEVSNHAFNLTSLMLGVIFNYANELLIEHISTQSKTANIQSCLPKNLSGLLQVVKIWCDWLSIHLSSWMPLPTITNYDFANEYEINPWDDFAELITLLSAFSKNYDAEEDDIQFSKFEEDWFLDGFSPISGNSKSVAKCPQTSNFNTEIIRIKKIIHFGATSLCNCSPPLLKRIANDGKEFFINITNEARDNSDDYEGNDFKELSINECNENLPGSMVKPDEDVIPCQENSEVGELLKRKQELEQRKIMEEKYEQNLHNILQDFGKIMYIEVRPKYLVPDTNCFIDSLNELQIIARDFKHYLLAVPLVVVNELEGLSKGIKPSSSSLVQLNRSKIHHFDEVSSSANKALQFIKSKNCYVKCVTSKGSFLNTASFDLEEQYEKYESNDDKILTSAINIAKTNAERNENGQQILSTSVVLITTDRNLRVKALCKNLPVSELQQFLRWAKLSDV